MAVRPLALSLALAICCSCSARTGRSGRATSTPASGRGLLAQILDDPRSFEGREVTVRGFVVLGPSGCLDMVCTTASGCCGTCTADAMLAESQEAGAGERRLFLAPGEGTRLGEGLSGPQNSA